MPISVCVKRSLLVAPRRRTTVTVAPVSSGGTAQGAPGAPLPARRPSPGQLSRRTRRPAVIPRLGQVVGSGVGERVVEVDGEVLVAGRLAALWAGRRPVCLSDPSGDRRGVFSGKSGHGAPFRRTQQGQTRSSHRSDAEEAAMTE